MEFYPAAQAAANVTPEELFDALLTSGFKKFSLIKNVLQPINIPEDIAFLTNITGDGYVNLICSK
jgi:predicted adenine nucleotide alpha hydrolase (AANH) superfamily ATPase